MGKWFNQVQEINKLRAELKRQAESIRTLSSRLNAAGLDTDNPYGISDEERILAAEGREIEAIKEYRKRTGADLLTGKHAIDTVRGTN